MLASLVAGPSLAAADCTWLLFEDTQFYRADDPVAALYVDDALARMSAAAPLAVVVHPGDVADNGGQVDRYARWSSELGRLDGVVPYVVVQGNHDGQTGPHPNFLAQFGVSTGRYDAHLVDSFDNANYAVDFSCDGVRFLVVALQWRPADFPGILPWADGLITSTKLPTVVVTHDYGHNPLGYFTAGQAVFDQLVSGNDWIVAVLSGHQYELTRVVQNDLGNDVLEMMANYQWCDPNNLGPFCAGGSNAGANCAVDADCPGSTCSTFPGYGQGFTRPIQVHIDPVAKQIDFSWTTPSVLQATRPELTYVCTPGMECYGYCPRGGFNTAGATAIGVSSRLRACNDGVDNDGDGWIDYDPGSGDPGCASRAATTETTKCQDGLDNDWDGRIDFDGGVSAGVAVPTERDLQCGNATVDRENVPRRCGLGFELALLAPPLLWARRRYRASSRRAETPRP